MILRIFFISNREYLKHTILHPFVYQSYMIDLEFTRYLQQCHILTVTLKSCSKHSSKLMPHFTKGANMKLKLDTHEGGKNSQISPPHYLELFSPPLVDYTEWWHRVAGEIFLLHANVIQKLAIVRVAKKTHLPSSTFSNSNVREDNEQSQGGGDDSMGKVFAVHTWNLSSDLLHPGKKLGTEVHSYNPRAKGCRHAKIPGSCWPANLVNQWQPTTKNKVEDNWEKHPTLTSVLHTNAHPHI